MIAVEHYRPEFLLGAFAPRSMFYKTIEKLIPRYRPDDAMSTGKALGMAYSGHTIDRRHSSAIGLFASLRLTFGDRGSYVAVFVLGLIGAAFFALTARIGDRGLVFLLHFVGMQQSLTWILSGNMDVQTAATITTFVLLLVSAGAAVVMTGAASHRGRAAYAVE